MAERRQYHHLVKYRKTLFNRVTRIRNPIWALFDQQDISILGGHPAWTVAGMETLSQYRQSLDECGLAELWQGELDPELHSTTSGRSGAACFMGRRAVAKAEETTMHWMTGFMSTNISFAPPPNVKPS